MRPSALIAFTSLLVAPPVYSQEADPPPELAGERNTPPEDDALSESPDLGAETATSLDDPAPAPKVNEPEADPSNDDVYALRAPIPAPPDIDTWEYVAFPAYLAAGLILKFGVPRGDVNWSDPPGFDAEVRDAFALDPDGSAHEFWGRLGDIMYIGGVSYSAIAPFLTFNSSRGSEFAFKYGFVHFESLAFAGGTVFGLQMLIRRGRPNAIECYDNDPSTECDDGHKESFPGGHMTMTTTVAALSCMHDTRVGLYDSEVADWTTCGVALFGAVANFLSRLFVSKHYLSDQVTGIALGMFSGGLLPYLLHPELGETFQQGGDSGVTAVVAPRFGDNELGLQVLGMF